MKNYNILIVFILISILSGCGGKNYLGEKVVVSTTNLRLIEDNNSFSGTDWTNNRIPARTR